jgi:hypothetical protein
VATQHANAMMQPKIEASIKSNRKKMDRIGIKSDEVGPNLVEYQTFPPSGYILFLRSKQKGI